MSFQALMRYRMALDLWFCRKFDAARNRATFTEPRPQLEDFDV